mmetsp:Transcript_2287/g.3307  ORF Transcript_2287/g.3307 Transcript_2287/m.3307 type:complete len:324 (-) Transcript_2287:93-1064(-)
MVCLFGFLWSSDKFSWKVVWEPSLFGKIDLHSLETQINGGLNVVNLDSFRHITHKLRCVEFIVGSSSLDDLGLFLNSKVGVVVGWINVLCVKIQDFVVRNNTRIGEIVNSGECRLCHGKRGGKHFVQHGHRIRNIHDTLVLDNLCDEISVEQIVRDWHAHTKDQAVGVVLEQLFHVSLGFTVEGFRKVGNVFFDKANSGSKRMCFVVLKDTSGSVDCAVNLLHVTQIGNIEGSNHVGAHRFWFVIFTPVNVWASGDSGRHEHVGWLYFIEFLIKILSVFQSCRAKDTFNAILLLNKLRHELSDPSGLSSIDEDFLHWCSLGHL